MLQHIGFAIFLLGIFALVVGLISPKIVIFWPKGQKTRTSVVLISGLIVLVGILMIAVGVDSFEEGKRNLLKKDYSSAILYLSQVNESDENYLEAQKLLNEAKENFSAALLAQAKELSASGEHEEIIELLADFPEDGPGSAQAADIVNQSKKLLAVEKQNKQAEAAALKRERLEAEERNEQAQEAEWASQQAAHAANKKKEAVEAMKSAARTTKWNVSDPDSETNGNAEKAVNVIKAGELGECVQGVAPSMLKRAPWEFYGKAIAVSGRVSFVEDHPAGSDTSEWLGGGKVAIAILNAADGTAITLYLLGGSQEISEGFGYSTCALPVGRGSVNYIEGGTSHSVVMVARP